MDHPPAMSAYEIRAEDFTGSLAAVVDGIGLVATLKLVEKYGGASLYVPAPDFIGTGNEIVNAIGLEAARKLCALFGGEKLEVACGANAVRRARNRVIRNDLSHKSQRVVAREHRLSQRQVRNIQCFEE